MSATTAPMASDRPIHPRNRSRARRRGTPLWYVYFLVGVWIVGVLGPFVIMLLTAITPASEFISGGASYLPTHPTLAAFVNLVQQTPFLRYLGNSLIVALATVAITLTVSVLAANALSRYRFRARRIMMFGVLLVQLFPAVLLVEPLYAELRTLHLLNSLPGLFIVYSTFAAPFSTWLLKGFMDELPMELDESARVDGCSGFQVFWHVLLPLTRPGLAAAATYAFIYSWNEYLYAVTFTSGPASSTVPVGLSLFIGENTIRWELLTAGGVVAALPIVVGFMFVQRQLIAGLTSGAVKG